MSNSEKKRDERPTAPVPKAVVSRLSLYLRELERLVREGTQTTSSRHLGRLLGFTDAQVRKDLAYFGHFGHPGIGYRCEDLTRAIRGILGTDRLWNVALVGVGNLGRALLRYKGFRRQGFRIAAAFDVHRHLVGTTVEGVEVHHLDGLAEITRTESLRMGLIAVPASAAQSVAERLVAAGIVGIVNFAPVTLAPPDGVAIVGVDLAMELEQVSFCVVNRSEAG